MNCSFSRLRHPACEATSKRQLACYQLGFSGRRWIQGEFPAPDLWLPYLP